MIKKAVLNVFGRCCVCGRIIPEDKFVLKHEETGRVICLICLTEIAEIE